MFDTAYLILTLLIFIRLITFFSLIPVLFPTGTPAQLKIAFSLLLAFIVSTYFQGTALDLNTSYSFISAIINEVMSGMILGLTVNLTFEAFRILGSLLDMHIGLSMLSFFDPNSKSNSTLIERLFYTIAITLFLISDGHHLLIKIMIESYTIVPLGRTIIFQESIVHFFGIFISSFLLALKLALPIILIIILTDITLGLVARAVPQLNVMIIGLPIKLVIGLAVVVISLPIILRGMASAFDGLPELIRGILKAVPIGIIFASEEKTEEATPRKKSEARKKGQVAKSKEVNLALTLLACTLLLASLSGYVTGNLRSLLIYFLNQDFLTTIDYLSLQKFMAVALWKIALIYLPIAIPIMLMGVLANFIQTGFILSSEPIKPQLSKLNPISGFKRMFSKKSFMDLLKNLAIVGIVGYIGYGYIRDNYSQILTLGNLYLPSLGVELKNLFISIFSKVTLVMVIIALVDFIYQRYSFNKDLKMTKQEIKEEFKQDEGDPQLKSKIKQRQREIASRRMMQAVPEATVVVTNPTHYAVALKYEDSAMAAPKVVAKGADIIALKIKEIAKANNVPIIENRPLARRLYDEVDLEKEIPQEMYQGVAELLAALYKLKKGR